MESGMLWFDNDQKTDFTAKVRNATAYYQKKYGKAPNACYVHPSMLPQDLIVIDGVRMYVSNAVIPFHFWVGMHLQEKFAKT